MRRWKHVYYLALMGVTGCAVTRVDYQNHADYQRADTLAGSRAALDLEKAYGGLLTDTETENRLWRVYERLKSAQCLFEQNAPQCDICSGSEISFQILDSNQLGAFSLASGRIYVTRGLAARLATEDQTGAVIAHELAHICAGDGEASASDRANARLAREKSADEFAARLLAAAGYDQAALIDVLQMTRLFQPHGFADARIASLKHLAEGR